MERARKRETVALHWLPGAAWYFLWAGQLGLQWDKTLGVSGGVDGAVGLAV